MRLLLKGLYRILAALGFVLIVGLLFMMLVLSIPFTRQWIFIALGNGLVAVDAVKPVQHAFVLGGEPWERGTYAATLYHKGWVKTLHCTGKPVHPVVKALKKHYTEAQLTAFVLKQKKVKESAIIVHNIGTSTLEEVRFIFQYAQQQGWKEVAIISSRFHTGRIRRVVDFFQERYPMIHIFIWGAPHLNFQEKQWWKYENGMIFVNNEYMKMLYYWWNYGI